MTRRFTNLIKPKKGQQDIIKLVETDDQESLKKAAKELDKIRLDYSASKQKKWIISAVGFIIFGISIFFIA